MEGVPSTLEVIWSYFEATDPHVSLTPLAAFFSLAALQHDAPLGYHTPPPLAPMVHHCRVPARYAHAAMTTFGAAHQDLEAVEKAKPEAVPFQGVHLYTDLAQSSDSNACVAGVWLIRKLTTLDTDYPALAVVESGVVLRLIELASMPTSAGLQALWVLNSILERNLPECDEVLKATPTLVMLARTTSLFAVAELAAWGIGNVAMSSLAKRDYVLQIEGGLALLTLVDRMASNVAVLRQATWAMSVLCRGKPSPKLEMIETMIPTLHRLLQHPDAEVAAEAAWAMSYISDGTEEKINAVVPAVNELVRLLASLDPSVALPAVRALGNIVAGPDHLTQFVLDAGCLPCFHSWLASPLLEMRKLTCWTLSNITACDARQIQQVIDAGLFSPLLNLLQSEESEYVMKEAVWAVANATRGPPEHLLRVFNLGALPALTLQLQQATDVEIIRALFNAVSDLLSALHETTNCREQFIQWGGVVVLQAMANSHIVDISTRAGELLEKYFDDGEPTV